MKFTRFLSTQTLKPTDGKTCCNEQHVRISRSMLYSEAYMSLDATAMKLYQALRLKYHKEEENNLDFQFSRSLGVKLLNLSLNSEKTIRNGLKELIEKGFIERTFISNGGGKNSKIANRYRFSCNWKTYKKEYTNDRRFKNNK